MTPEQLEAHVLEIHTTAAIATCSQTLRALTDQCNLEPQPDVMEWIIKEIRQGNHPHVHGRLGFTEMVAWSAMCEGVQRIKGLTLEPTQDHDGTSYLRAEVTATGDDFELLHSYFVADLHNMIRIAEQARRYS